MTQENIQVLTDALMVLETTEGEALRQAEEVIRATGEAVETSNIKVARALPLKFFEHVGKYKRDEEGTLLRDAWNRPILRTDKHGSITSREEATLFRPVIFTVEDSQEFTLVYNQQAGQLVFDVDGGKKQYVNIVQGISEEERKETPSHLINKNKELQRELLFDYLSIMFEDGVEEDEDW